SGTKTLPAGGLIVVKNDLSLQSSHLTIGSGQTLKVINQVTNLTQAENFVIQSDANLIQVNAVDNAGSVTSERNTTGVDHDIDN
ncbi:hypothetical protein RSW36_27690, partial [Escherichia coli]|uniref:hypothetical protein n=1 Tax=Escherichia coli TaxID=562 RepID=UPI0028DE8DA9